MFDNHFRKKRLFLNKNKEKKFINTMINRGAIIKQVEALKRNLGINDEEAQRRAKMIREYNMIPPTTKDECDQMIKDLKEWQI